MVSSGILCFLTDNALDMKVRPSYRKGMTLHDYMAQHGLTDEKFGLKVGRHRATVSRWRRGKMLPDWEALQSIMKATGGKVSPVDFFPQASRNAA